MHTRLIPILMVALLLLVPVLATDTLAKKPPKPPPPPPTDPDPAVAWMEVTKKGVGQLWVMNADGSNQTVVYPNPQGLQMGASYDWSPDGQQLAFFLDGGIYVIDVEGSNLRWVADTPQTVTGLAWSPAPVPGSGNGEYCIAYTSAGQNAAHLVALDGSPHVTLASFDYHAYFPTWSPSGTRLAVELNPLGPAQQVWGLYDFAAGTATEVPHSGPLAFIAYCGAPGWSKTQEDKIAWTAGTGQFNDIWVVDLDDPANPVQLSATPDVDESFPSWSPDDQKILLRAYEQVRRRSVGTAVVVNAVDGSDRTVLSEIESRLVWRRNP